MVHKQEPQIEIDTDLTPDWSAKGFKATWQEGALIAYAELLPIEDQPARGYILECGYNTATGREPTNRQIDAGTTLTSKVRELMIGQMVRAGWSIVGAQHETRKNIWQHSSRLAASSASKQDQAATTPALQVEQDQDKRRKVLAIPANAERRQKDGYTRTITAQDVSFDCERCASKVTRTMFPGRAPRYCDDCAIEVKREKTRERVARLRAGQKGEQKRV